MTTFLTVKQAAEKTGKSPSSIRRIIYPIIEHDDHADRLHIEPSVDQVKSLRIKGENFAWKISEELLGRHTSSAETRSGESSKRSTRGTGELGSDLFVILQRELDIKNQQIAAQNDLIKGLSERLREGNILIGSLQQQLTLTDGSHRNGPSVVDGEQAEARGGESAKSKKPKNRKRSFFGRLLSR